MRQFIITATDTDVGKTVFAAMLTLALDGLYWKPVQAGVENIDTRTVQRLTGLPDDRFLPEKYMLSEALSPHRAAELDRVEIDIESLTPPDTGERPLIIEGAGGLMVPLTRRHLQINLFKRWKLPVILCARTGLGTINHTLLSLEALWARNIPVHGLVFIGEDNPDNMRTISEFSDTRILGHVPLLPETNPQSLLKAFRSGFIKEDFS